MPYTLIALLLLTTCCYGQRDLNAILKKINASTYRPDGKNGDGVMLAKSKKTKKWGMYQAWNEKNITEMIPAVYDSIDFFEVNAPLTGVWKKGKVGIYLSPWTFEKGRQSVECLYDAYQVFYKETAYLAVRKDKYWAWIDWMNGELKTDFIYQMDKGQLPPPNYKQEE